MAKKSIAERMEELEGKGQGTTLSAKQWDPEAGDILVGEYVFDTTIEGSEAGKHWQKLTLKTDDGLYNALLRPGILDLADKPLKKGDIVKLEYEGLIKIGNTNRQMHSMVVTVFPLEDQ